MKRLFFAFICCALFTACASKPRFKGDGDLCGLIVDENNSPVKDFIVYCEPASFNVRVSKPSIPPVITNESGLFVFYGLPSGQYLLSGRKVNYLELGPVTYRYDDRTKIICLQTKSFRAAVLSAEELLQLGQTEAAGKVLGGICCEAGSPAEIFFKEYLAKLEEVSK